MSITTTILLAAASMFPALIASVGRCYREKDLFSFACCELPTANLIQITGQLIQPHLFALAGDGKNSNFAS